MMRQPDILSDLAPQVRQFAWLKKMMLTGFQLTKARIGCYGLVTEIRTMGLCGRTRCSGLAAGSVSAHRMEAGADVVIV